MFDMVDRKYNQEQAYIIRSTCNHTGIEVIKLEYILILKIKRNDWLLADTCPQATNHCAFLSCRMYSSLITWRQDQVS